MQPHANNRLKKVHAVETLNVGPTIKKRTHADHSDMVDAKALKTTLSANKRVNTNARTQLYKKVNQFTQKLFILRVSVHLQA